MRSQENAIEVNDITKKFRIYFDKGALLKEKVIFRNRNKYEERWVLNGISFDVKKGEAIGLIGHNGCGKSTTLKLLTRIMFPDSGSIDMCGRVSSLLELGAGFHPDMSGRDNIYINASIFGLSKKEIDNRLQDIIDFSELAEFIDNPVRTYSSGMYMRLAFSVAINVNADILLIDEILAVGDANFQNKCFNKMLEIKKKGTTIVLVSHALGQIEQICERTIWIHEGLIRMDGSPREVHNAYLEFMEDKRRQTLVEQERRQEQQESPSQEESGGEGEEAQEESQQPQKAAEKPVAQRRGSGEARMKHIKSYNRQGEEKYHFKSGEDIIFEITYETYERIEQAIFGLSIFRIDGTRCYGSNTRVDQVKEFVIEKDGKARVCFDHNKLLPGRYFVDVCIARGMDMIVDYLDTVNEFEITGITEEMGFMKMSHSWEVEGGDHVI
ncbi:MAG: ABC transporter ATP-binding protein [Lachnospiraceae bacterium]|nr:ABC transporter ATP-binding protein [Lachnospiraceae bacterium]